MDSFLLLLNLSTFLSVTLSSASCFLLYVSVSKPDNACTLPRFGCPLQDRPPPLSVLLHLLHALTIHHNVMQTSRSIEMPFLLYVSALSITIATNGAPIWYLVQCHRDFELLCQTYRPHHHWQLPYMSRTPLTFFSATPDLLQQFHRSSL